MKIYIYKRPVNYYETDGMGCVHHSNYIRWFEEARTYLMRDWGFSYESLEAAGILSPVVSVEAVYKSMARFGETIAVETEIESYTGVRMSVVYTVRNAESGEIRCTGKSTHCFTNSAGRPLSLKKAYPQYDAAVRHAIE